MTREEAKQVLIVKAGLGDFVENIIDQIYDDHEAQLKAKDEEIERLEEIINTSIEEIEYAIIKPQYAEVYLNNAIRFLKDNK